MKTTATTEATSPQATGHPDREARVIAGMRSMRPSHLQVELDLKTEVKEASRAMDTIKARGPTAADWIEAGFQVTGAKAVVFQAHPGGKGLSVEKDLGPHSGPVKGDYKYDDDTTPVNWYTFGRIDVGVPTNAAYLVVRVRR